MGVEIERKFVVPAPPSVSTDAGDAIWQGYLAVEPDGNEVRLRRTAGRHLLGAKSGAGLVRQEIEVELTAEAFEALWPATAGRRVRKVRYRLAAAGAVVELDVFTDQLDGLCLAEVEFASVEAATRFTPPDWFGAEVTGRTDYLNRSLALHGRPATL
jgi:adenylate cyclase